MSAEEDFSVDAFLGFVAAGLLTGSVVRPLFTHNAIAAMLKLMAISIAEGRYVPMLTKRLSCSKR